jgi:hypothetical protein
MVAGKSPISSAALTRAPTKASPKLPPLPKLTIRRPVEANANPCLTIMATMLGKPTDVDIGSHSSRTLSTLVGVAPNSLYFQGRSLVTDGVFPQGAGRPMATHQPAAHH